MRTLRLKGKHRRLSIYVDDADYGKVSQLRWFGGRGKKNRTTYADTPVGNRHVSIHRLILGLVPGDGKMVDHKDGNGLNNQRSNLRVVGYIQNNQNHHRVSRRSKSGVRGVYWHKGNKKWRAHIKANYRNIHLGNFNTLEEAMEARRVAGEKYHGEFAGGLFLPKPLPRRRKK